MEADPGMDKLKQKTAFNKIACKHVDFVLCDKELNILLAIELDDSSHNRQDRKERDEIVNAAFRSAGLPLMREPAKHFYDIDILRQRVFSFLP
jgi:very-short-patch-repair endonuclease